MRERDRERERKREREREREHAHAICRPETFASMLPLDRKDR